MAPRTTIRATETVPPIKLYAGTGTAGVSRSGGYVTEEFLRELQRSRGLRAYREMLDNDALIGGMFNLIGGLFRTLDWTSEPRDMENSEDVAAAEFIEEELEALAPGIREMTSELLDVFAFGFVVAEVVYRRREDGKIGWQDWRFMAPETLDRWVFDEDTDDVLAFVQRAPSTQRENVIPLKKCVHLRTTRRKGNPEGRSILRNAWRSWFYKTRLEEIEAIGCERDLAGLPVIRLPVKYMHPNATPEEKMMFEEAKKLVRNIRRDEHEGVVLPSDTFKDGTTRLMDLELLSTGGSRAIDINKVIERHEARMVTVLLADFMLLGHQQVGTFSLSSDKTSMFSVVLGGFADVIADELTRQASDRLLTLNGISGRAIIKHGDFEKENVSEFAKAVESLVKAGVVQPDPNLEEYMRTLMNLPEPDEEWLAEQEAMQQELIDGQGTEDPTGSGLGKPGDVEQGSRGTKEKVPNRADRSGPGG